VAAAAKRKCLESAAATREQKHSKSVTTVKDQKMFGERAACCREKKRLRGNNSCWRVQKLRECGG